MKESMVSLLISGGIVAGGFIAAILSAGFGSGGPFPLRPPPLGPGGRLFFFVLTSPL